MKLLLLTAIFGILVLTLVSAQDSGHLKLLAVSESGNEFSGTTADLYLEVTPGSGRVFMSSTPASKVDTQISTTFANQIVCKQFALNCQDYDFFYTIRASSSIVGGPSAGAAVAVLTVAVLNDAQISDSGTITGTINSGGIIGPVGGIKQKIEAAADVGLSKVLIPRGERFNEEFEVNLDLVQYGESLGVEVVETSDIFEAVSELTNQTYSRRDYELNIDESYSVVMQQLAADLCTSAQAVRERVDASQLNETLYSIFNSTADTVSRAEDKISSGAFYSGASLCFSAGINYRYLSLVSDGFSASEISALQNNVQSSINEFDDSVSSYDTLTDLQTYIIVKDRTNEARQRLNISKQLLDDGLVSQATFQLAYSIERLQSAQSWSSFFGKGNDTLSQSRKDLQVSCSNKLAEADERYNYVRLFFPQALSNAEADLDQARNYQDSGAFELCLFQASKITAEANTVLSVLGVTDEQVNEILALKLSAAEESIEHQTRKGNFPIVGYSYYEYAKSLNESDKYSALLYSEYALEMSNLDVYLQEQRNVSITVVQEDRLFSFENKNRDWIIFFSGILSGLVISLILSIVLRKKSHKKIIVRKH